MYLIHYSSFIHNNQKEDRRIKINDISDVIKPIEYINLVDKYIKDSDVQYSFFWYCIDNVDLKFNEGLALKLLPVTEKFL